MIINLQYVPSIDPCSVLGRFSSAPSCVGVFFKKKIPSVRPVRVNFLSFEDGTRIDGRNILQINDHDVLCS